MIKPQVCIATVDYTDTTNMSYMFNGCSILTKLDLSNFNTSIVRDMSGMFLNCNKLTSINLSSFDTWFKVRDSSYVRWVF